MPTPKQRIRSAINRLALKQPQEFRMTPAFTRTNDPRLCCFCNCAITYGDQYRNASTIRAHESCFKAVAAEFAHA